MHPLFCRFGSLVSLQVTTSNSLLHIGFLLTFAYHSRLPVRVNGGFQDVLSIGAALLTLFLPGRIQNIHSFCLPS